MKCNSINLGGKRRGSAAGLDVVDNPKKKQLKVVTHDARDPEESGYRRFDTTSYYPWRHGMIAARPGPKKFIRYSDYDHLDLFTDANVKRVAEIPHGRTVRLDDFAVHLVGEGAGVQERSDNWPPEFNEDGMIRASRMPLGLAAKVWASAGDVDIDGNKVLEDGWYYVWYRGIHLLCGHEGLKKKLYMIRPRYEKKYETGFKVGSMAVIQLPPGKPGLYDSSDDGILAQVWLRSWDQWWFGGSFKLWYNGYADGRCQ